VRRLHYASTLHKIGSEDSLEETVVILHLRSLISFRSKTWPSENAKSSFQLLFCNFTIDRMRSIDIHSLLIILWKREAILLPENDFASKKFSARLSVFVYPTEMLEPFLVHGSDIWEDSRGEERGRRIIIEFNLNGDGNGEVVRKKWERLKPRPKR